MLFSLGVVCVNKCNFSIISIILFLTSSYTNLMDDDAETYRLWRVRKTVMQVCFVMTEFYVWKV